MVIAGHTHFAREILVSPDRVYLNTGSWTDLQWLPSDLPELGPELLTDRVALEALDERLRLWIEELVAGRLPPLRRLSYAEVTETGPRLRWWLLDRP